MVKVDEQRELRQRISDMQPGGICQCCRGSGINGGERCEWCDGWGEWSQQNLR